MLTKEYLFQEYTINRKSQSQIAKELELPTSRVEYYIKKFDLCFSRTKFKFSIDSSKFTVEDPVFCYFIGLIATDGWLIPSAASICWTPIEAIDTFNSLIKYFNFSGNYKVNKNGTYNLSFPNENNLIRTLINCGIPLKNKTFNLTFPTNIPKENMFMYLRGTLDGDGNIKIRNTHKGIRGGEYRICTASTAYIESYSNYLVTKLNLNPRFVLHRNKYPMITLGIKESFVFYDYVYSDYLEYKLNNKYNKYLTLKQSRARG